ncbi:hypothetical protein HID58_041235 [Brassica napus]|uniref:Secreted protein n=1 Tax=Brassica napus TaxID=3708 RepID=A0ABQ8BBA0_BRANA|nr:hypothetical protein HID58_041235 [Brassica napus]
MKLPAIILIPVLGTAGSEVNINSGGLRVGVSRWFFSAHPSADVSLRIHRVSSVPVSGVFSDPSFCFSG